MKYDVANRRIWFKGEILNINDANYSYTILPNGNKTLEREIIYTATENNKYSFRNWKTKR